MQNHKDAKAQGRRKVKIILLCACLDKVNISFQPVFVSNVFTMQSLLFLVKKQDRNFVWIEESLLRLQQFNIFQNKIQNTNSRRRKSQLSFFAPSLRLSAFAVN